jgi:uncharacterized delta-60 repeat protein
MVTSVIGISPSTGMTRADAVAVQPDSKVVVVGLCASPNSSTYQFAVARYNTDGGLDSTFANGGELILPVGSGGGGDAYGVEIQPDGKILVSGTANTPSQGSSWTLVRLNSNGTLDTTFGGGTGEVFTSFMANGATGSGNAYSIALQTDGKIVVAGNALVSVTTTKSHGVVTTTYTYGTAVARYNTDGSLDTSFGSGGKAVNTNLTVIGNAFNYSRMMAIDAAGRIDVVAQAMVNGGSGFGVERYLPNGTLDPTFGTGGVSSFLTPGDSSDYVASLGLQSSGEIVVDGRGNNSLSTKILRLNINGGVDTTFASSGVYTDSRLTIPDGMIVQPDDKILVTSRPTPNGIPSYQFAVSRVLADGSAADASFGSNGIATTAFPYGGSAPQPYALALGPDGKIAVTGFVPTNPSTAIFAAARFLGDSTTTMAVAQASTITPLRSTSGNLAPTLIVAALDSPDLWDLFVPLTKRRSAFKGSL